MIIVVIVFLHGLVTPTHIYGVRGGRRRFPFEQTNAFVFKQRRALGVPKPWFTAERLAARCFMF